MTGNELRAARKAAGLTQLELSEHWGVNRLTVQNWERKGDDPVPFPRICEILVEKLNDTERKPARKASDKNQRLEKKLRKIMADICDVADDLHGSQHQRNIDEIRKASKVRELTPIGRCHFCEEPFESGAEDKRIFCDSDCATDHESMTRMKNNR